MQSKKEKDLPYSLRVQYEMTDAESRIWTPGVRPPPPHQDTQTDRWATEHNTTNLFSSDNTGHCRGMSKT